MCDGCRALSLVSDRRVSYRGWEGAGDAQRQLAIGKHFGWYWPGEKKEKEKEPEVTGRIEHCEKKGTRAEMLFFISSGILSIT